MRHSRAFLIIGVALCLALGAVLLAASLMGEGAGRGRRVVVAGADIGQGSRLSAADLKLAAWPSGALPAGAVTDIKALDGRVTRTAIGSGEPVLESKLALAGNTGGLSAVVAPGKRAMTVRVNDVVGVAGFALPGNYVDVLVNLQGLAGGDDGGGRHASISKIVLERILVLAVAQDAGREDTKARVVNAVTLELAPDQVEALDLARSIGKLSLVLRNQADPEPAHTGGATRHSVLGLPAVQAEAAPAPRTAPPVPAPARRAAAPARPPAQGVLVIRGLDAAPQAFN